MISGAYVIHISQRNDRDENIVQLRQVLTHSPLSLFCPAHLTVFEAKKQADGRRGCYESHVAVMRLALEANATLPALIFEDDAQIAWEASGASQVQLRQCQEVQQFFNDAKKFDILYLGSFPNLFVSKSAIQVESYQHIYQSRPSMTHAYIASPRLMKLMTTVFATYEGVEIDNLYSKFNGFVNYAVYPSIFLQSLSASDISPTLSLSTLPIKEFIWSACEVYVKNVQCSVKEALLWIFFFCVLTKLCFTKL